MKQENIKKLYHALDNQHKYARSILGHPLTLSEKIIWSHLNNPNQKALSRGRDFILLRPDRVAMQDATAQMAILQFVQARRSSSAVPATIHCDHLIRVFDKPEDDLSKAKKVNKEVYDFLRSAAQKFGIGFWKPGSGIIHQIVLENYAFPGGLMIGTDSHTPNAGGLGMAAIGVGGADAVDVMVGLPWEVLYPNIIGVHLTGNLNGWCSGKDIILKLLELLTVKGGTNRIVEYFGSGIKSLSCTAQATASNMGAELGATCSLFPYHKSMADYLKSTGRNELADLADKFSDALRADPEVLASPEKYYDEIIEIDLDKLEPYIAGPHTPDAARPLSKFSEEVRTKNYPSEISAALIGSCTNSSYEDMGRSAHVASQCIEKGVVSQTNFLVTPGSEQVRQTAERDGFIKTLSEAGALIMTNACGPCIGQWERKNTKAEGDNSIVTSFNRNFPARNDGNPKTLAFVASPEIVTAMALTGKLDFNPVTDTIFDKNGREFRLVPPKAEALPVNGFQSNKSGFVEPAEDGGAVDLAVTPDSRRLQLLNPFEAWDGKDFVKLTLLAKVKGKCTTDHISPAGPWLKYRGHLDNISNNMLTGAVNAFSGETGKGLNQVTGDTNVPYPEIARFYKAKGMGWIIIGDENYGEGSSREHAAMSPRFLGARVILTRSIARIHETNLKKQGILPLQFSNPADFDKIQEQDKISVSGLSELSPGGAVRITLHHAGGEQESFDAIHTFNEVQIKWFKAGSALNLVD